jgi:hypothetical protein
MLFVEIFSVLSITEHKNNTLGVALSSDVSNLVLHYTGELQTVYVHSLRHATDVYGKCEFP